MVEITYPMTTLFLYSPFTHVVRPRSPNGEEDLYSDFDVTHLTCGWQRPDLEEEDIDL
jgi:hypothetical protein